jgi:hypothetical protein
MSELKELGEELNSLLDAYLNADALTRMDREHELTAALWDNKSGIVAALRAYAPTVRALPEIPDDDADFTPDLARKIIAKYQELLCALPAAKMREALEFIRDGYERGDINHVDYRVGAYKAALDALEGDAQRTAMTTLPSREAMAREIDPKAWGRRSDYMAEIGRLEHAIEVGELMPAIIGELSDYPQVIASHKLKADGVVAASFRAADRIIALTQPRKERGVEAS